MRGRVSDSIPSPSNHRLFRANRLFIDLCLIIGGLRIFYINITSVDDISMRESNQTEGKESANIFTIISIFLIRIFLIFILIGNPSSKNIP